MTLALFFVRLALCPGGCPNGEFPQSLPHYADQRISLDLDDGVKVKYGKFGDLLAEIKAVTGKK